MTWLTTWKVESKERVPNKQKKYLLAENGTHVLVADVVRVLHRDDDGVDANGDDGAANDLMLGGDLCLGVGAEPLLLARLAQLGHLYKLLVLKKG